MISRRLAVFLAGALALAGFASAAPPQSRVLGPAEARGKTVYTEGRSGRGNEAYALVLGGDVVPAAQLPCVQCHRADGRGGDESFAPVPEIRWHRLTSPHGATTRFGRPRPAYDEALLKRALREGLDAAGEPLDAVMPHYEMAEEDLGDLVAYLRVLGTEPAEGTTPDSIRVGALLPLSGPLAAQGRSIAALVERAFRSLDAAGGIHGRRLELVASDAGLSEASALAAARRLAEGGAPVFCFVASGGHGADPAVAQYLESRAIPAVGPLEFAPDGVRRGSTYYLLASLESSARAAAIRILRGESGTVAVVSGADSAAKSAASAFAAAARRYESRVVELEAAAWSVEAARNGGFRGIAFFGSANEAGDVVAAARAQRPAPWMAFSSVLLGGAPPAVPGRLFLVSPPVAPGLSSPGLEDFTSLQGGATDPPAVMDMAAFAAAKTLMVALRDAGRDVTRDRLVEALRGIRDLRTGVLPPVRFGVSRRDGTRGALVATFAEGGRLEGGEWIDEKDRGEEERDG